jgi:hypothetical protein
MIGQIIGFTLMRPVMQALEQQYRVRHTILAGGIALSQAKISAARNRASAGHH